ncbi:MAG: lysine--tRNA ligase [Planctomycetaceae bacterium]|nr:lysine--tRNA ligase [Planctomycetaceae bacterium]
MSSNVTRLEAARLEKLEKIKALGLDPWGQRFDGHIHVEEARNQCPEEKGVDGPAVRIAGRIARWSDSGKLRFGHVQDYTGRIQVMISRKDVGDDVWSLMECLERGDIVGVDGILRVSNTGEKTVFVTKLHILCKSLAQPPEKWHGLQDTETQLRQRYTDMIYNPQVLERMFKRLRIMDAIRATLKGHEYFEVETPVLHAIAGGAAARPFVTHHNALDIPLYLRIALELHLKRLMVGGIERVYEMARVFRNEGVDSTHNPEFTMIELYQAYGDYESMMDLAEELISNACRAANGATTVQWGDLTLDFTPPFQRARYGDLFREHAGCDMEDEEAVRMLAHRLGIEHQGRHIDVVINDVFEATVEDKLVGPVFVIDYPAAMCPLTKRKAGNPAIAERFELFIHGMELANAYTELNDPLLQDELFRTQLQGLADEDSMAKMDHDFVRALKVGMPAAGGMGIGIDRLVMLLTNTHSIRDVIFFPLLKPEQFDEHGVSLDEPPPGSEAIDQQDG